MIHRRLFTVLIVLFAPLTAAAEDAIVAVAANFLTTAEKLAGRYEAESGHRITIVHGATGQIYAQIRNGAPYDIFLAADTLRPAKLAEEGRSADRATYAIGQLSLIGKTAVDLAEPKEAFIGKTVALADPTVAPYGLAATSSMESLGLDTATFRSVLVSDVGQVASIYATGNADFAFVATSLLDLLDPAFAASMDRRHPPIRQDGVLLTRGANNPAATGFWGYLFTDAARQVIAASGYGVPE